ERHRARAATASCRTLRCRRRASAEASRRTATLGRQHREGRLAAWLATARLAGGGAVEDLCLVCGASRAERGTRARRLAGEAMTTTLLLQMRGAVPSTPLELITDASTLTQVVLIILALLSLLSWAMMLALWRELARA